MQQGIDKYVKLLSRYCNFSVEVLADVKNGGKLPPEKLKAEECQLFKNRLKATDTVILLDENGKTFNSEDFASYLSLKINEQRGRLVFVIGGAFGFDRELLGKHESLALSKMTFNHQMVRLIFSEQIFRAFTIIHNTPYHH